MTKLTITANITAKADQIDLVKTQLEKVIAPTRQEAGCISYLLHQNNEDPAHFFMFENWESRELWQAHLESAHFKAFAAATEGALAELAIHEMTQIA
jgi:quinol monooxygenase YgiN